MYWWTGIEAVRRVAYLPHHLAGGLLLVLSILLLSRLRLAQGLILVLIFISLLLAFIHPPSLFIILLVLPASIILFQITNSLSQKKLSLNYLINRLFDKSYLGFVVYWLASLALLLFMLSQTNKGFPWSQYLDWEKDLQFPLSSELVQAMGILFPFSLIGILSALLTKKYKYIMIVCWLIAPFLLTPFAPFLGISNIRLIQGVPFLPLSILAIFGIKTLLNILEKITKRKAVKEICLMLIFAIFTFFTVPSISWSMKNQINEYWPIFGNVYLDNRLFSTFDFINNNFPPKTNTLSTFYSGNYLPAYTHTTSYLGHFGYTYNLKIKEEKVMKFFQNKMSPEEAKELILSNNIVLIFQGPEEKPIHNGYLYPEILKPVYDKDEATVYVLN